MIEEAFAGYGHTHTHTHTHMHTRLYECLGMCDQLFFYYSMFMDTPEDERTKLISCLGAFRQYWGTLPQVSIHMHSISIILT